MLCYTAFNFCFQFQIAPLHIGNQQVVSSAGFFTYERPVITAMTSASIYGGPVTITGRNFGGVDLVPTLHSREPGNNAVSFDVTPANTPTGQAGRSWRTSTRLTLNRRIESTRLYEHSPSR